MSGGLSIRRTSLTAEDFKELTSTRHVDRRNSEQSNAYTLMTYNQFCHGKFLEIFPKSLSDLNNNIKSFFDFLKECNKQSNQNNREAYDRRTLMSFFFDLRKHYLEALECDIALDDAFTESRKIYYQAIKEVKQTSPIIDDEEFSENQ